MRRDEQIAGLVENAGTLWDIIIIGGGATGAGIALDASSRGYRTLLLERGDFSQGTSSRSTKLVHGGVRYLAQGDLLLVIEALKERGIMLKNAPHLTSDQQFIIPVYSWFDMILYTVGLKFYDLLSGRLSLGKSYFIGRKETLERLPNLKENGLRGGVIYHDGQFDDARMNLELVKKADEYGCTALNYFKFTGFLKNEKGRIDGVTASDSISGSEYSIHSRSVINATGVFANDILRLDDPASHPILKPSQGIHLVLDKEFLGSNSAIMIPKTRDGRVLFAIPWYGKVVAGTTDTPLDEVLTEPGALDEEIAFILDTAGDYLKRPPRKKDILTVFAGLRPLASDPENPHSTKEISRRHKIIVSASGLITVTGGKWTTYRRMAAETIERAISAAGLRARDCKTEKLVLNRNDGEVTLPHMKVYGLYAKEIAMLAEVNPSLAGRIHPSLPYTIAEIIWICRNEMAMTVEDVLARRTRALFLDARASVVAAPEVARIMAGELGRDAAWERDQVNAFVKTAGNFIPDCNSKSN